ncbi:MAG: PilW family protein [Xanthomonadales bacterium]|nr:PilW family protein [Xanthomonadales bacterium]
MKGVHRIFDRHAVAGLSLVELMISIVLGLLITGAAVSMFLSFSRTYAASESLSRSQENARVAFELMARDLREAGTVPCSRHIPVTNVLNGAGSSWWNSWASGIVGHDNGALSGSVAGTDAIQTVSGSSGAAYVTSHVTGTATFGVTPATHGFVANDILMACNYSQGAIFQMTGGGGATVIHNNSGTPGNCSRGLGFKVPPLCTPVGEVYQFPDNSTLVRLQATRWYVAANGRGGNSLFRVSLRGSSIAAPEEVVEGVVDMQVRYLTPPSASYRPANDNSASGVSDWSAVTGARISLILAGSERVAATGVPQPSLDTCHTGYTPPSDGRVYRCVQHTVALRSRNK